MYTGAVVYVIAKEAIIGGHCDLELETYSKIPVTRD
jgi:hypothetical protein